MAGGNIDHLAGYIGEPFVQRAVLECLDKAEGPLRLSEIARRAGVTVRQANRALPRLHDRGLVQRWKIPMTLRFGARNGFRGYNTRMVNVYVLPGKGE